MPPPSPDSPTRTRILQASMAVFANRGFEAASLREITTAADVNIAAIHYHFGSKEALVREVLRAVSEPVNRARLQALDALEQDPAPRLEQIVEALVAPPVRLSFDATGEWRLLIRLLIQARALPSEHTNLAIFEQYDTIALRFVDAFLRAEPGLTREVAFWRYAFAIGSMMYIVSDADETYHRLHRLSAGLCDTDDAERIVAQLIAFVTAGIRAAAV